MSGSPFRVVPFSTLWVHPNTQTGVKLAWVGIGIAVKRWQIDPIAKLRIDRYWEVLGGV